MDLYEEMFIKANCCLNCKTKPCMNGCPLNNDIPEFIKNIKEKKYDKAYKVLLETTVFSSICGRICPHMNQCKGSCVRGLKGEPVDIGILEAFVGDMYNEIFVENLQKIDKSIGIIGSGPAGLTCGAFLAMRGYNVTIYEKYDRLGGILLHSIPDFRLDKNVLEKTINKILKLGIKVELNKKLGETIFLEDLKQVHDAIFISIGANVSYQMGVEGEELEGIYGANNLLENKNYPKLAGKKVGIIGGGNVAVDIARTIKRLGAESVNIIYRKDETKMKAEKLEIMQAKNEGVVFVFETILSKVIGNTNVEKIECFETVKNNTFFMDMDYIIIAIGSKTEEIVKKLGLELDENGYIKIDKNYMTSQEKVFAGGDVIGEKSTVAWASKYGREASDKIHEYLNGVNI